MNARLPTDLAGWKPDGQAPQRVLRKVGGRTVPEGRLVRWPQSSERQRHAISGRCAAFGALPRLGHAGVREQSAPAIDRDPWPPRRRAPSVTSAVIIAARRISSPRRLPVEFLPPPPGAWGRLRLKKQGGPRVEPTAAHPQPQERRFSIRPEVLVGRIGGKPALRPTLRTGL